MSKASKPRWDPWPVSIVAFFTIAISGSTAFIVFCNRHPSELVADNYYDQEVRYQGQMERRQRAQQSPDPARISYDSSAATILIALPAHTKTEQVTGKIQLYRPSSARLDQVVKLEPDANGIQRIDARDLAPGLWQVRLSWTAQRQDYYLDQRIVIPNPAGPAPKVILINHAWIRRGRSSTQLRFARNRVNPHSRASSVLYPPSSIVQGSRAQPLATQ